MSDSNSDASQSEDAKLKRKISLLMKEELERCLG